jgi:arylsulfatase A
MPRPSFSANRPSAGIGVSRVPDSAAATGQGLRSRRAFLKGIALGAGALGLPRMLSPLVCQGADRVEGRPNILFILTDDQGWPTLGCYGCTRVPTPHLDTLAREGMRFTDAYVMAQCTPTRAALLTGQHTARNRMWHVIGWYGYPWAPLREPAFAETLPRETFTVAKGLKAAGYATACLGKWHLSTTSDGSYIGLKPEAAHYFGFDYAPAPPSPRYHQEGDKGVGWLTDQAIGFIEKHRAEPWFVYLAHHTIHGPVVALPETVAKYLARGAPKTGLHNATYLAALETLDQSVGRLLRRLDELKLSDNTLVVFLSDNGGVYERYDPQSFTQGAGATGPLQVDLREFSNAPLRAGKGSQYEGGIRVPCLVRWPGVVKPGSVSHTPIHVVDWLPTLLEAAGGRVPAGHKVDGDSQVPLLKGGSLAPRRLYWYLPFYELRWGATPCAVIREGDWKLIEYFGDWIDPQGRYVAGRRLELFNLFDDLGETTNLADRQPEKAAELSEALHAWMRSVPVEVPGPNPHYDPQRPLRETREKQPWN